MSLGRQSILALLVCILFGTVSVLPASTVTWTAGPTTVTDEVDIDLTGTLVHAGHWGGSGDRSVTVGLDSILFEDRSTAWDGEASATAGGEYGNGSCFNATGTTVGADFEFVLDGFAYDGANPKIVTLGSLSIGQEYQIQLFTSDDRGSGSRTQEWSDNATNGSGNETATFRHDDSAFVIGTFTADAATQSVFGRGVAQSQNIVNAYVLRAIPEPGSLLLIVSGLFVCLLRRRRIQ